MKEEERNLPASTVQLHMISNLIRLNLWPILLFPHHQSFHNLIALSPPVRNEGQFHMRARTPEYGPRPLLKIATATISIW